MSGHSKWSTIKRKKAKVDAEKGKLFTKIIKEITIAARIGGAELESNPRLRSAVESAKAANMPAANIDRAIKKGTGELPGVIYEEVIYEGFGPGGAAIYVEATTDNKNRTVAEIRHLLAKHGGNLGNTNSVAWMFERKGMLRLAKTPKTEEEILAIVTDAGAEDISKEGRKFLIMAAPEDFESVRSALDQQELLIENASLTMIPKNTVKVEGKEAEQLMKLIFLLEDHDDVQKVYSNFDIEDSVLMAFEI